MVWLFNMRAIGPNTETRCLPLWNRMVWLFSLLASFLKMMKRLYLQLFKKTACLLRLLVSGFEGISKSCLLRLHKIVVLIYGQISNCSESRLFRKLRNPSNLNRFTNFIVKVDDLIRNLITCRQAPSGRLCSLQGSFSRLV